MLRIVRWRRAPRCTRHDPSRGMHARLREAHPRQRKRLPSKIDVSMQYPGDPEKGERSSLFRVLARTPFNSSSVQKFVRPLLAPRASAPLRPAPGASEDGSGSQPSLRVRGGFLSFFGGISYQIRILLYRDVSRMYPACIL